MTRTIHHAHPRVTLYATTTHALKHGFVDHAVYLLGVLTMVIYMMSTASAAEVKQAAPLPGWFVTSEWLADHLNDPGLRILQVGGENYYDRLHLPGAVLVPYKELVKLENGVPGMRADRDNLARLFGRVGVSRDTRVVAYDATGGLDAARLVWTLTTMGHREGQAAVLEGGVGTWFNEKRPLEKDPPKVQPTQFQPRTRPDFTADIDRVQQAAEQKIPAVLLDTRSQREYLGLTLQPPRGHIPGAVHREWMEDLRSPKDPRLKTPKELREHYARLGLSPDKEVIVYCQTAHRAAHTWLTLRALGLTDVRLYDGSMAEWGLRQMPVTTGK